MFVQLISLSGGHRVIVKVFVMASCNAVLDVQRRQPNTIHMVAIFVEYNGATYAFFGLVTDE